MQAVLERDPCSGHVFVFRGKRVDLRRCLWLCDGGLYLLSKRLEKGRFAWPRADSGVVALTTSQLALLEVASRSRASVQRAVIHC
ncbi:IS66 family insertion sequence element accessory protein TnpB [Burkholderia lata]|uniref:IS66 family insertion sequence element accessory protein TnpB n=1 Tax=Burkholderia lata (strain ATCC 17760 / DSM 23089 / LMG 22485 / NCIMB 9086 / R18194 / 383) TaxID=482957 RepID=UPI003F5CA5D6